MGSIALAEGIWARFLIAALLLLFSVSAGAQTPQDLLTTGHVDQALQILNQKIQTSPTAEAYNLACRAHFEFDSWDAGIPFCEKAVSLEPENGVYHLWLGRIYGEKADRVSFLSALGMAKKVRAEFESAVEFAPNNWEARTDLAEFYMEAPAIVGGGKDKARAQAELIAPLNPTMAHWVKGRIAERNKDNAAAEQEFRAAVASSQSGARAWVNLAGFYRRMGRFDDMEQALRTMESRPPDHSGALLDGAGMLLRTGRGYPMGVRFLRTYAASSFTVEEAPVFKAYYVLGQLLERQGNGPGAAEQYRAALALAHSYRPAQEALKRVAP
jgi:tetratricopeptide (TPR) repeat protein